MTGGDNEEQRRRDFRIDLRAPVQVRVSSFPAVMAQMLDLSGSGCRLAGRFPSIRVGDQGEVIATLADWMFISDFVVRFVVEQPDGSTIGVEFESMTSKEKDQLVRAVFAEHRRQLRRP